jgi:hypothetical protein
MPLFNSRGSFSRYWINVWVFMRAFTIWLLFLYSNGFCRRAGVARASRSLMGLLLTFRTGSFIVSRNSMPENPALLVETRE